MGDASGTRDEIALDCLTPLLEAAVYEPVPSQAIQASSLAGLERDGTVARARRKGAHHSQQ